MKKEIGLIAGGMLAMYLIIIGINLSLRVKQLEANMGQIVNMLTQRQQVKPQPVMVPEVKK